MENYMGQGWYPKYGEHEVKIKLQWGKYKGEVFAGMSGNVMGGSIICSIAEALSEGDFPLEVSEVNKKHIVFDEGNDDNLEYWYPKSFILRNGEDELHIDADDDNLGRIIVGIEIIDFVEDK